ncbi:MAG: ABC transporter substrate-binding protein [Clostridia bacterium]|nr:ABC transporter substrate-binding protein [Clostridia bacterium]
MKRILASILAAAALTLTACGSGENNTEKTAIRDEFLAKANEVVVNDDSVTFTDASGDGSTEITIAKNPGKTINLYASFTTLWYEAGGSVIGCIGGSTAVELYNDYIGRDITADDGVTVVSTSSAGKKWDVETILALQPDLIICSTAMSGYSTIEAPAAAANIPLIAVEYNDFSDYLKWFKVFCNLTGHPELWDSVAMKALDEVVSVLASCPTEDTPTVFSMFSGADSLEANTSNTVVGGMISAMNASNIVDSWGDASGAERLDINLETVYAADPDIIIVQCHAGVDSAKELVASQYGSNPVWQELRAVKEGRVYYLEKTLFHNKPNSRFAEAYTTLAEILYPELAK